MCQVKGASATRPLSTAAQSFLEEPSASVAHLRELVPVFRLQVALHLRHEPLQADAELSLAVCRLRGDYLLLQLLVDLRSHLKASAQAQRRPDVSMQTMREDCACITPSVSGDSPFAGPTHWG